MFELEVAVVGDDAKQTAAQKAAAKKNLAKARQKLGRNKVATRTATGQKKVRNMTARGAKISKALRGKKRGPHSAARKKAISLGMRRYWRSKRAAWRRKGAVKRSRANAKRTGKRGNARRVANARYLAGRGKKKRK